MTLFDILALLLVLAALFGFINQKLLKLPRAIGLVVIALVASGAVIGLDAFRPQLGIGDAARSFLQDIDFPQFLLEGILSALLFAGAVHIDLSKMRGSRAAVFLMATFGVVITTVFVGGAMWLTARALGLDLPMAWALVFGALIAPTDPVAVLGMLKTVRVPASLESKIAGESLFNDGVAVVVFTILLAVATGTGPAAGNASLLDAARLFGIEAIGGAGLGLVCGIVAYLLISWIDEHNVEVMITLALVTGTFAAAQHLGMSGPIAVVIAGLLIGNRGRKLAMSETTREHVFQFWDLTDEILNAILFLLIGLEVLVIGFNQTHVLLVALAIPIVLVARWTSVSLSLGLLRARQKFTRGAVRILTWGGLRGGISVALALSLPATVFKEPILSATYAVVIFSIIVQGLTMRPLVRRLIAQEESEGLLDNGPAPAPADAPEPVESAEATEVTGTGDTAGTGAPAAGEESRPPAYAWAPSPGSAATSPATASAKAASRSDADAETSTAGSDRDDAGREAADKADKAESDGGATPSPAAPERSSWSFAAATPASASPSTAGESVKSEPAIKDDDGTGTGGTGDDKKAGDGEAGADTDKDADAVKDERKPEQV